MKNKNKNVLWYKQLRILNKHVQERTKNKQGKKRNKKAK